MVDKKSSERISNEDTAVIAASQKGYDTVFLKNKCWYPVRMSIERVNSIKYLALYRLSPISAITHYAEISIIKPLQNIKNIGIYAIDIKPETITELSNPILKGEKKGAIQSLKYTSIDKIKSAHSTDDL